MSQFVETACRADTAAAAIDQYLRVKTPGAVATAGATDACIGTMDRPCNAAGPCTVRLRTAQGTCKMVASGAITKGNAVYAAASGKIAATGTVVEGIALETSAADDDVIEVMPVVNVEAVSLSASEGNTAGVGITGTAAVFETSVQRVGGIVKTSMLIDLTGLNSGGSAGDIIGADGAGVAHLGQITAALNGTIIAGKITCFETPAGGDPDIDLWYANEATGVEDTAITALTGEIQTINHGDWTAEDVDYLTAFPAANKYLYLTTGAATDAAYTAGILLIELWGTA